MSLKPNLRDNLSLPDALDCLADPAEKGRLSYKLKYSCEQRSRRSRMVSEIMVLQHPSPSPQPLSLEGSGARGEGNELVGRTRDSWRRLSAAGRIINNSKR